MNSKKEEEISSLNQYYTFIETLSTTSTLSARLRFMLLDLLELRAHRWVARREEEVATTLAAIHKQADREARNKQNGGAAQPRRKNVAPRSHYESNKSADGWETVATRPRLVKSRSSGYGNTAAPTPRNASGRAATPPPVPTNKSSFAPLMRSKSSSKSSSSSQKTGTAARRPVEKTVQVQKDTMSRDEAKRKIESELKELFKNSNVEECRKGLCEVHAVMTSSTTDFDVCAVLVQVVFNMGLERGKEADQALIATLMVQLHAPLKLASDHYVTFLSELVEDFDGLQMDIPLLIPYLVTMLTPLIASEAFPLSCLLSTLTPLASSGKGMKLVLTILDRLQKSFNSCLKMISNFLQSSENELIAFCPSESQNIEYLKTLWTSNGLIPEE